MKTGTKYRVERYRGDGVGTYAWCDCDTLEYAREVASDLRRKNIRDRNVRIVTVKTTRRVIRRGGAYAELYPIVDEITGEDVWGWRCNASPYTYSGSATTFDEARETARRMLRTMLKSLRKTK
jgi:hydrogenase maturation factor HypE